MKARSFSSIVIVFILTLLSCYSASAEGITVPPEMIAVPSYIHKAVTPVEAKKLIGTKEDLILVDVRSMRELRMGVIKGALLVSLNDITKGRHNLPKEKPILLTCTVGGRSSAASRYLIKEGFKEVYYLEGGVEAWKDEGFPVQY